MYKFFKLKGAALILAGLFIVFSMTGCFGGRGAETPDEGEKDPPKMTLADFQRDYITHVEDIPTLYLTAQAEIVSKTDYVKGTMSIVDPADTYTVNTPIAMEIRGRGNSSWGFDKKPYRIKLSKKTSILGKAAVKNYALIANYSDKTYMRNYMAQALARSLDGMDYNPDVIPVQVYLKIGGGESVYQGFYGLTDQLESGASRVDVEKYALTDKNRFGIESGFMVEIDDRADFPEEGNVLGRDYFVYESKARNPSMPENTRNFKMVLKYPKYDDAPYDENAELFLQVFDYIQDYCTQFLDAVFQKDYTTFNALCDVNSFADFFMVQEIMANVDAHYLSLFFNKKLDKKLQMGPVWDFDISAGNCYYQFNQTFEPSGKNTWSDVFMYPVYQAMFLSSAGISRKDYEYKGTKNTGSMPSDDWYIRAINPIFSYLMNKTQFRQLFRQRYMSAFETNIAFWLQSFNYVGEKFDRVQKGDTLSPAGKDRDKWKLQDAYVWPNPMKVVNTPHFIGENSQVEYLYQYLNTRCAALKNLMTSEHYA